MHPSCTSNTKKKIYAIRIDNEVRSKGAHPLYGVLSWRALDPKKAVSAG